MVDSEPAKCSPGSNGSSFDTHVVYSVRKVWLMLLLARP